MSRPDGLSPFIFRGAPLNARASRAGRLLQFPMKYYKILVTAIALAFTWSAQAAISAEKRAEINRLLELTGLEKLMEQMKGQMLTSMKASSPQVPAELWERLSTKMNVREVLEK